MTEKKNTTEIFNDIRVKNAPMMSLKFFSHRFLIKSKYLEYGIVEKKEKDSENDESILVAAILIKSPLPIYIDILEDKIFSTIDYLYNFEIFPCEPFRKGQLYVFRSGTKEVELDEVYLDMFYSRRALIPSTRRIIGAIPSDFYQNR